MAYGPLLFGGLLALGVMLAFAALVTRLQTRDPVEARLTEYGVGQELEAAAESGPPGSRRKWPLVNRLLAGFGLGPALARRLMRADIPLTAAEFALIIMVPAALGFVIGTWRANALVGLVLAAILGAVPVLYLNYRQGKRIRAFTEQLPDMLTLLIGALRAGHGLSQALAMVVDQVRDPAAGELRRVLRAVSLGLSTQRALNDMTERLGSDDLDLVVTAMNVQYEMGGDLVQTLDIIAETVRDRIRMKREIRVLTAQQRFTGYVLAGLPIVLCIVLYMISPQYMSRLFRPDMIPVVVFAVIMQIIGFLVIRKIVDIEV
jgi:tight adherence protein B